jgi:hypothetical protein
MSTLLLFGREIEITKATGPADDIFFEAIFLDTEEPVTEDADIAYIEKNYYESIYNVWLDGKISAAEYLYDY